jgi:hypothetical protein
LPAVTQKNIDGKSKSGLHRRMKTKTIGLTLAFCFLAGPLCLAADPLIGTWKLNEAKSKFTPGTGKNTRVVYEAMGGQVRITADGVNVDGKPTHSEWSGKLDGKDYSVTGDPNADMRSYRKVDDRTLDFTVKKGGNITVTGRVVVAADGKSRTVTTSGTTGTAAPAGRAGQRGDFAAEQRGKKFKNIAVFDKQ